jgi:hypothetical protein
MISLRKISAIVFKPTTSRVAMNFSNNWKDRDEAAEKVYISQAESKYYTIQRRLSRNYLRK